ncbi:MAG: cytidine deaminase [Gemmataceae bacterium]
MSERLVAAAREARERAFAPFSKFRVGAALEAEDGTVITGCNVESASYGLTMCAERVAIFKAVSEGKTRIVRVAIVTDAKTLTSPCGACRQLLWEFAPDADVILANLAGVSKRWAMPELLPDAFDASKM